MGLECGVLTAVSMPCACAWLDKSVRPPQEVASSNLGFYGVCWGHKLSSFELKATSSRARFEAADSFAAQERVLSHSSHGTT